MDTKQELFSSTTRPVSPAHTVTKVTPTSHAVVAITAAKMRRNVGRYASTQYAVKRGVTMRLYRIAVQCEAAQRAGL